MVEDKIISTTLDIAKVALTPSIISTMGAGFALANNIIGMIEDPARRAKARRLYIDSLNELRERIKIEQTFEKIDDLLLSLIASCHDK